MEMAKRRVLNRKIVIETAVTMANEYSDYHSVTLTNLAKVLNIQVPSLYNHIANLDDLYQGMAIYGLQQLNITLRTAAVENAEHVTLLSVGIAYRSFAKANPGIYPLTIRAPESDDQALITLSEELFQILMLVFTSLQFTGEEALHAVRGIRAIFHGFMALEAAGGYRRPLDTEVSYRRLILTYLQGLDRAQK